MAEAQRWRPRCGTCTLGWSRKDRTVQGLSNYRFSGVDASGEMQELVLWGEIFSKAKLPTQLGKACHAKVRRTRFLRSRWPEFRRILWREQHQG